MLFRSITLDYQADALFLADAQALKLVQPSVTENPQKGVLPRKMTLEIVYGHAWVIGKHLTKARDNLAYIQINQIGRKTSSDSP